MYFRLMAAIFDLLVTLTSEIIYVNPTVLLDLKNVVICRKFTDITLESRHPIYIRSHGRHFGFCRRGLEYCKTGNIKKNVFVFPYRSVKTA